MVGLNRLKSQVRNLIVSYNKLGSLGRPVQVWNRQPNLSASSVILIEKVLVSLAPVGIAPGKRKEMKGQNGLQVQFF